MLRPGDPTVGQSDEPCALAPQPFGLLVAANEHRRFRPPRLAAAQCETNPPVRNVDVTENEVCERVPGFGLRVEGVLHNVEAVEACCPALRR